MSLELAVEQNRKRNKKQSPNRQQAEHDKNKENALVGRGDAVQVRLTVAQLGRE